MGCEKYKVKKDAKVLGNYPAHNEVEAVYKAIESHKNYVPQSEVSGIYNVTRGRNNWNVKVGWGDMLERKE